MKKENKNRSAVLRVCLFVAVAGVLFAGGLYRADSASREAIVCDAVCRQVLENTTEGRQALVSSVWWPPLPVLFRLPFAAVMRMEACPVSSLLISALFGSAVLFLLERILKEWNIGWPRFLMVPALAANPFFLEQCFNGSSGTTVIFLAMLTAYGLVQWVTSLKLRFLIYLAFGTAFLAGMSFEMCGWVLMVLLLVIADQATCAFSRPQKEAVLILAFLPLVYTVGLWVLMNWLIMGDGLYFLRSLLSTGNKPNVLAPEPVLITSLHYVAACISLLVLVISATKKSRAGVWLGALGFGPLPLALFLAARGFLWDAAPVLFCLFPFCIMALGYAAGTLAVSTRIRILASLVPLAVTLWAIPAFQAQRTRVLEAGGFGPATIERHSRLIRIQRHVLARSRYAKVFVCGYDGFLLLGARHGPIFVRTLDFNFNKAKNDYPGHTLYVLVHRPEGRSAMDSIHWKYDRIFTLGSRSTLYDGDWGDWRLFEIIQASRTEES